MSKIGVVHLRKKLVGLVKFILTLVFALYLSMIILYDMGLLPFRFLNVEMDMGITLLFLVITLIL